MKTVLITGAGGFIAGQLAARCQARSWRVIGTTHRHQTPANLDRTVPCSLGDSLTNIVSSERIDAVVHTANYVGPDEYRVNFEGTLRWYEEMKPVAPLQVLLSSLSALAPHPTDYGRAKRDLEARFLPAGAVVARLGLVAGPGGVFGRMIGSVRRSPLLPLLDGGRTQVFLVAPGLLLDFLVGCIDDDGKDRRGKAWHLHQPLSYPLREILSAIRRCSGSSCRFVSLPSALVLPPVILLEALGFRRLPVSSANIRGLRQSPGQIPTDFRQLGGVEASLDELVSAAMPDDDTGEQR